ncbi:hypothetical protein GGX14DRAFT_406603 [Mycena pura]|uniref:Uncharacterized protein n=1 Tax=Mycena pura TaxID=153505 RepID=A0AAD6Y1G5_9AGAR|nr:hypothetical protein GGX14DRAFT_406603 [Mycena pura]
MFFHLQSYLAALILDLWGAEAREERGPLIEVAVERARELSEEEQGDPTQPPRTRGIPIEIDRRDCSINNGTRTSNVPFGRTTRPRYASSMEMPDTWRVNVGPRGQSKEAQSRYSGRGEDLLALRAKDAGLRRLEPTRNVRSQECQFALPRLHVVRNDQASRRCGQMLARVWFNCTSSRSLVMRKNQVGYNCAPQMSQIAKIL